MNSPEASYAPSAAGVRAACGRLVNAATAAIGPELDPAGRAWQNLLATS